MLVIKELRDCLFLLIAIVVEEIFMISHLMTLIKKYDEVRKVSTGQGDDYTISCLLDFAYFKNNYRLIATNLNKQKALNADPRETQQIIFTDRANAGAIVYNILEQSKEITLQFSKGTEKVLWII